MYALDVLQQKNDEGCDNSGRPHATDRAREIDVNDALKTLVEHATNEFGFVPTTCTVLSTNLLL